MESQEAGFPPFPHSLEIPSGLPHSHSLTCWDISRFKSRKRRNPRPLCLKGVVTQVLGPKCNEGSGTLTPLREAWFPCLCASAHNDCQGRVRQEQAAEVGGGRPAAAVDREETPTRRSKPFSKRADLGLFNRRGEKFDVLPVLWSRS